MEIFIYKEEMELLEKALRDEVELLKLLNQNRVHDVEIINAKELLKRFEYIKRLYDYKVIFKLS